MSELQFSLLAIGLVVVAGVFLYGQWQQWHYRRSIGPLHDQPADVSHPERHKDAPATERSDPLTAVPDAAETADAACGLLNDATDYVATLLLKTPSSVNALENLWQRRSDFGKSVNACGLNTSSSLWERLIPESPQSYRAFRLGLQLEDRSGSQTTPYLGVVLFSLLTVRKQKDYPLDHSTTMAGSASRGMDSNEAVSTAGRRRLQERRRYPLTGDVKKSDRKYCFYT